MYSLVVNCTLGLVSVISNVNTFTIVFVKVIFNV